MIHVDYMNNTNVDVRDFHAVIMEAIANGGKFTEDFEDIFSLTKTPDGSCAKYVLDFVWWKDQEEAATPPVAE